jgi:hypothetical protein
MRMRGAELNTAGPTWKYRPAHHKNAHRGLHRVIFLGRVKAGTAPVYSRAAWRLSAAEISLADPAPPHHDVVSAAPARLRCDRPLIC